VNAAWPPELFRRYAANPILTPQAWPYRCQSVFNAGATILADGTTLLLCRVEGRTGQSHLCVARSENGLEGWVVDQHPTLMPDVAGYPEELDGIEDPRITYLEDQQRYAITYTSVSRDGPGVSLALTSDFRTFERCGLILRPHDKNAALLSRKIGGEYAIVHRPSNDSGVNMWISYSPDLHSWGNAQRMLRARKGTWWDSQRIGLGAPPIETERGWLVLYHGARGTAAGSIYRVGLALFDAKHPEICLRRGDEWVLGPETQHERVGDVGHVVFPCGAVVLPDRDTLRVYYGAADTCIAVADASLSEMLDWLDESAARTPTPSSRPPPRPT